MELRRVPGLRPRGTRLKALFAVLAVVTTSGIVLAVEGPAVAASTAAPSVAVRVSGVEAVSVSGRTATASPRVRFDRRSGSGWVLVKRTRAHAHRYATTLSVVAGTTARFRVTSNGRSRRFVVSMPARTAPAKPQPTLYDDCGARPRKPDGSAWSCTFHDDFSGTALDRTKWVPQTTSFATGADTAYACYRDDPANVSVGGGVLSLTVLRVSQPVDCGMHPTPTNYVSGMVSTWHKFSQQYGRYEARVRNTATTAPGLHEAFWLWPDDRFPSAYTLSGEIDVSETYSAYSALSVPFLHYGSLGPVPGTNTAWNCAAPRGQWNTYALEWTPTRIAIYVNGTLCLSNTSAAGSFQAPSIVAFTQGLGQDGNTMVAQTPIPATMDVDYVRVWQ